MKRKASSSPEEAQVPDSPTPESIHEDDLCPICHLLLYNPVTTKCYHITCSYCMKTWADNSVAVLNSAVSLDHEPEVLLPLEIETSCPMCRRHTTASPNREIERELQRAYPRTYAAREAEVKVEEAAGDGDGAETLVMYVGNTHSEIRVKEDGHNKHEWNFFIRPSRTDVIEEVQVFLHPTFRNPKIILQYAPYEVRRLGWGFFTIYANVILKAGYRWLSSDAVDAPDGGEEGSLPLEWTLDFEGLGSQQRRRLRVMKEKEGQEVEDVRQREEVRRLWMRQRERDPDWVDEPVEEN